MACISVDVTAEQLGGIPPSISPHAAATSQSSTRRPADRARSGGSGPQAVKDCSLTGETIAGDIGHTFGERRRREHCELAIWREKAGAKRAVPSAPPPRSR